MAVNSTPSWRPLVNQFVDISSIANTHHVFHSADLNRAALNSASGLTELIDGSRNGHNEGLMREILNVVKDIQTRVAKIQTDVEMLKETRDLEVRAMQEWRPQVSNDVKAIEEKLSAAEKR